MNRHVCSMQRHSCIVLRHLCYMGRHVSVQCDDTPASATSITWAGTSLFSTTTLLHYATAPLLRGQARLFQYFTVPSGTYLVASLSFIVTGLYRQTFI